MSSTTQQQGQPTPPNTEVPSSQQQQQQQFQPQQQQQQRNVEDPSTTESKRDAPPIELSSQQQSKPAASSSSKSGDGSSRAGLPRGKVAVILSGFPDPFAEKLAGAALQRGHMVAALGLGSRGYNNQNLNLLGSPTNLNVIEASNPDAKRLLSETIEELKTKEGVQHVVGIDCGTEPDAVNLFNELSIPFVHHGAQGNSQDSTRLIETTRLAGTPSVISPWLSRPSANLQLMLRNFARSSPGLFEDWILDSSELLPFGYTVNPFSRDVLQSFSLLTNRTIDSLEADLLRGDRRAQLTEAQKQDTARAHQRFALRDGSGTSEFTLSFTQDSSGDPNAVMDMAEFLLNKVEESISSSSQRIWTLEDWAFPRGIAQRALM
jgi:hypothetical protein